MSAPLISNTDRSMLNVMLLVSILATLTLVFVSASEGIRGTDQYQYIADAESIRKHDSPLTNLFFPAKIVKHAKVAEDTNYFSHNGPLLHIVANSTLGLDTHSTWIIYNCFFHLITALATFLIAKTHTTKPIATLVTTLYIASPIALWQTSNVLQEMFFCALISLCLLCYYFRKNLIANVLLPLLYFIGALSHPIFVLTGVLHGTFLIVQTLATRDYRLALTGVATFAAIVYAMMVSPSWFPTQFQPGLKEIITSAIPNHSNMVYHFQQYPPDITTELLVSKLIAATKMQFFSIKNAPFFVFTNIAGFGLLILLYVCIIQRSLSLHLIAPLAILFGAYIGIIVLQQNHARFQQIISPATFIVIALLIHRIKFNAVKPLLLVVVFSLTAGVGYAQYLRKQAVLQADALAEFKASLNTPKGDAKFLAIDIPEHGALAYALRPNKVLTVRTAFMQNSSIRAATELFDPEYILMKGEQKEYFNDGLSFITDIENQHFGNIKLYRY